MGNEGNLFVNQDGDGDQFFSQVRAFMIMDGSLVDISNTARDAGIKYEVAVTAAVWRRYIEWSYADRVKQVDQNTEDRLRNVVFMLAWRLRRVGAFTSSVHYCLQVVPRDGFATVQHKVRLKAVVHYGSDSYNTGLDRDQDLEDHCSTSITIMLPEEDCPW